MSDQFLNHERIHSRQWKELLHVGFIVWYLVEWFVRFVFYSIKWIVEPKSNFDWKHAYRNISFEREAYTNQSDESYIARRKRYLYKVYKMILYIRFGYLSQFNMLYNANEES